MKSNSAEAAPSGAYSPKEYWTGVARGSAAADATGFAPVLHPGAPAWFNELIDALQFRAMRRALALAQITPGARVLDVGCGTGRWLRRYQALGFQSAGVDATPAMLALARERRTAAPLVAGEAFRLPVADEKFDCVSDVTVVQHIPLPLQSAALSEMMRVLKPGGRLVLMELIRGHDAHIFPRAPQDWIAQTAAHGATLIAWFGQEFLVFDRLFVRAVRIGRRNRSGSGSAIAQPEAATAQHGGAARRAYWAMRRITATLSAWADPLAKRVLPGSLATHGVFVFRKQ